MRNLFVIAIIGLLTCGVVVPWANAALGIDKEEIETRVQNMSERIKSAVEKFSKVNDVSAEERLAKLDVVIGEIDNAFGEIGETGELTVKVREAIQKAEGRAKLYQDKARDSGKSSKIRQKYDGLARKSEKQAGRLTDQLLILRDEADRLQENRKDLLDNKELIGDLIAAKELDEAILELEAVVQSVQGVSESIEEFAGEFGDTSEEGVQD